MKGHGGMNSTEGFKGFTGGNSLRQDDRLNSSEIYDDGNGYGNNNNNSNSNGNKRKKVDNTEIREF
jgi:hypothetical protein